MKNHSRLYNLLAAGSLTVLLGLTFLLFRGDQLGTVANVAASALPDITATPLVNTDAVVPSALATEGVIADTQRSAAQAEELATLQTQNAKLLQLLQVMQERERQYKSQLDAANQALQALQAQQSSPRREQYEPRDDEDE